MISAWCCDKRLMLAQIATDAKSKGQAAVSELLQLLSLKGGIVTADALNCQRDIARQIIEKGGDYVLALKGNHRALHADTGQLLEDRDTRSPTDIPPPTAITAVSRLAPAWFRPK